MKRVLITIMVIAVLAGVFMIPVSAAKYEHVADELSELDLFRGTDNGYDLDSAPNRIQGLVMLIRLLGLEDEAEACESDHPFTDVAGWQTPYVAYAFENELTTGTSDTEFSPNNPCSAQMYVTYVLRALGYSSSEDGDFSYAGAVEFGKSVGIIDDLLSKGEFLRDQMVVVSYLALATAPKGGEFECLLEKLVAEGAVTEAAAAKLFGKLALFAEFMGMCLNLAHEPNIAVNASFGSDAGAMGALLAGFGLDVNMEVDLDASVIRGADISAAADIVISRSGEDQEIQLYFTDGVLYANNDGEKVKADDFDASYLDLAKAILSQVPLSPYIISEISKDAKSDAIEYSVAVSDAIVDAAMELLMESAGGLDMGSIGDIGIGNLDPENMKISAAVSEMKFFADADGALNKIVLACDLTVGLEAAGVPVSITISISLEAEITATGDDVTVDLPDDFSDYLEAGADGEAEEADSDEAA